MPIRYRYASAKEKEQAYKLLKRVMELCGPAGTDMLVASCIEMAKALATCALAATPGFIEKLEKEGGLTAGIQIDAEMIILMESSIAYIEKAKETGSVAKRLETIKEEEGG